MEIKINKPVGIVCFGNDVSERPPTVTVFFGKHCEAGAVICAKKRKSPKSITLSLTWSLVLFAVWPFLTQPPNFWPKNPDYRILYSRVINIISSQVEWSSIFHHRPHQGSPPTAQLLYFCLLCTAAAVLYDNQDSILLCILRVCVYLYCLLLCRDTATSSHTKTTLTSNTRILFSPFPAAAVWPTLRFLSHFGCTLAELTTGTSTGEENQKVKRRVRDISHSPDVWESETAPERLENWRRRNVYVAPSTRKAFLAAAA